MNKSVDPCEDFYQFACGNYANKPFLDQTLSAKTRFDDLDSEIVLSIISIVAIFHIKNKTFLITVQFYLQSSWKKTKLKKNLNQF